jgi:hypothetical protein
LTANPQNNARTVETRLEFIRRPPVCGSGGPWFDPRRRYQPNQALSVAVRCAKCRELGSCAPGARFQERLLALAAAPENTDLLRKAMHRKVAAKGAGVEAPMNAPFPRGEQAFRFMLRVASANQMSPLAASTRTPRSPKPSTVPARNFAVLASMALRAPDCALGGAVPLLCPGR